MEYFSETEYLVRRGIWGLGGARLRVYDPKSQMVAFCTMGSFRVRAHIRVFTGKDREHELFRIKLRSIADIANINATYDVLDSASGELIGAWRQHGVKSTLRDEWVILDPDDREVGMLQESNLKHALVRRLSSNMIWSEHIVTYDGESVARFKHKFTLFSEKVITEISRPDLADRRLMLAGAILLAAGE